MASPFSKFFALFGHHPAPVVITPPAEIIQPPKPPIMPTAKTYLERNPITLQLLQKIDPHVPASAAVLVEHLDDTLLYYQINTPQRIAAFLAQVLHESGHLRYMREIWGPTPAQKRYEGRADLGNTVAGDGSRFRGRGLIQTTGRANYARLSREMGIDFVANPQLLEMPKYAAHSAGAFWKRNNLNHFADMPAAQDGTSRADYSPFQLATIRINGGLNGYKERKALYLQALSVLPPE